MTEDQVKEITSKFLELDEETRLHLDEVCKALHTYMRKHKPRKTGFVMPNRISALLAVTAAAEYEKLLWERE